MVRPLVIAALAVTAATAHADNSASEGSAASEPTEPTESGQPAKTDAEKRSGPPRRREASLRQVFKGPFRSSRLFSMPTTDVIGAYMLSLSGDGSLLQETGLLTSAG
ncbi:MAG: hypothetical protein ACKV2T_19425, partial [Kofleriaceae bacterium]